MRYRELGKTGIKVSEIGFGTIPILSGHVPVLPQYFSPDTNTAIKILQMAYDYGCNLYDTAIPEEYGDAEYKLGCFIKEIDRSKIIISDKARFYDWTHLYDAVYKSAENLGTTPDIYFVHQVEPKNINEVFGENGALDVLTKLKKEGVIRYAGIATHYYDIMYKAALDERVDVIQGSGNIMERGMLERISFEEVFKNKGLILNKVYAAGLLNDLFSTAELIGGILKYPFSSALIGLGTFEQVKAAMEKEYFAVDYSFEEVMERITENKKAAPVACDRCQKCVCPKGYEIHTIIRQYNYYTLGKEYWALKKMNLNIDELYKVCSRCYGRECMNNCAQKLDIYDIVEKMYTLVKDYYIINGEGQ